LRSIRSASNRPEEFEETKAATRNIGKVIMISLAVTVLVEIVPIGSVLLGSPSLTELLSSATPMSYFLTARAGSAVNTVVSIGIAVAIINAVIAIIIQIARLLYASARDQSWPGPVDRALGAVHPRLHTPVNATLLVGVTAALAAWLIPFNWLLTATGASVVLVYIVVALSALRLRRAGGPVSRGYRMRWWPLPPLALLGIMRYVSYQVLRDSWTQLAVAATTMLVGVIYYFGFIHPRRGERWTLPDPIHDDGA
jgi:amino acid transporter